LKFILEDILLADLDRFESMDSTNAITIQLGENTLKVPQKNNCIIVRFKSMLNDDNLIILSQKYHDSIFIHILDNASANFNFNMLVNALHIGLSYFNGLELSLKLRKRFNCWVRSLGKNSYIWSELLDKPDYGLELFTKRYWPYFNVNDKDWQNISISVANDEYPNQRDSPNDDTFENIDTDKDYKLEYNISQKYNNFLGYSVLNPSDYPDINKLLDKIELMYDLDLNLLAFEAILRLLITPSSCHIIKNERLWVLVGDQFKEKLLYKDLFMHYMYYAMFILNHEYTVMFSKIRRNYRVIFTHKEALNMPTANNNHMEIDPYIQQLTDVNIIQSVPYYLRCNRYINPISKFEHRFYLATGGALTNIPLYKYNAAVSGSILIPCLSYSELEDSFKDIRFNTSRNISIKINENLYRPVGSTISLTESDKDFMSYLEYFYPSYHSLSDNEYTSQVLTQLDDIKVDDSLNSQGKPEDKLKYNLLSDIDISITTDNYDTFDDIAKIISTQIQANCRHIGDVWIKKVYNISSFKYKIYGPGLIRPIDLFRVPYGPEKMVKKFHCPIVRAWYDGSNNIIDDVHMHYKAIDDYWKSRNTQSIDTDYVEISKCDLDSYQDSDNDKTGYKGINILFSCVSAILSGVNNNYKWFFNSKPCVEVILKYAQRGFTTIINKKEIESLRIYMEKNPRWSNFTKKNIDMIGQVSKKHEFFNPCISNTGIRYKLRKFKKIESQIYSKKMYVGHIDTHTPYDITLNVKCNNKVYIPTINKIHLFADYIEHINNDEFSDGADNDL
jgi:hypothetical protein